MWKFNSGSARWELQGGSADTGNNFVSLGGVTAFSKWALASNGAGSPTAVTLSSFAAQPNPSSRVTLSWVTASEINTAGFNLYRSENSDGPFARINPQLIPASPDPLHGGRYEYSDLSIVPNRTYYYQLEDIELNGAIVRHAPISVFVPDDSTRGDPGTWRGALGTLAAITLAGGRISRFETTGLLKNLVVQP